MNKKLSIKAKRSRGTLTMFIKGAGSYPPDQLKAVTDLFDTLCYCEMSGDNDFMIECPFDSFRSYADDIALDSELGSEIVKELYETL